MKRTRAIEMLEAAGIPYDLREFVASEFTVEETARELGLPLEIMFKTLVVQGERRGLVMALVPGDAQLSLSKLAKAIGDKRCDMIDVEELFRVTGYLKGGCSPLGARKAFPVYLHESAILHERICVSAGLRGVQMMLTPDDLLRAANGRYADLVEQSASDHV
jgi:Cys-tRNA(Pro)/Cys-tRNA(Cys) deacylase